MATERQNIQIADEMTSNNGLDEKGLNVFFIAVFSSVSLYLLHFVLLLLILILLLLQLLLINTYT